MSLKDLFGKTSEKIVSDKQIQELYDQAESEGYLEEVSEDRQRYLPPVDFSNFSNFIIYGSAERYFVDGISNIYENYPYDGSKKEKQQWRNDSSQLDLYIFDNIYPKTKGYITLSGSNVSVISNTRSSSAPQYVLIKGGPNNSADNTYEKSNIYDLETNRESNLGLTQYGNTVEFWFKDNISSGSALSTADYCLFDLWNGNLSGSSDYTRLTISKQYSTTQNKFVVTYVSGTVGIVSEVLDYQFDPYNWHHYAFTFNNSSTDLEVCLYIDGNLAKKTTFSSVGIFNLANNLNSVAYLGAYRADQSGNSSIAGLGQSHGSYDEFRFWKSSRTSRQIYRNWFTSIGGGSNTDDSNTNLGVYLKFNEGIVNTQAVNSLDSVCLDYSGRVSNGAIINYDLNCKSTSSAIDIYFNDNKEVGDPIVFSSNPLVQSAIENYAELGFQYDVTNNSSIYRKLPAWITEEAEKDNYPDLQRLVQIISSYFDTLHLQIKNLSSIKDVGYLSSSDKPKPFYNNILSSHGFDNIEIFNNTTFLEDVLSRNESSEFEQKVSDIKNIIYQNIYNNLSYIYKSKGTEKSFRNLIRSFGVDNELVKINLYANNAEYDFSNKYNYTSVAKKFIDFNNPDRNAGTIIQKYISSDSNTSGFISGLASGKLDYAPITVQAEIIFPKKSDPEFEGFYTTEFNDVSLFGCHTADPDESIMSWHNNDNFNFQVYAVKRDNNSPDVYFKLSGSLSGSSFNLTSSWYKDTYDNKKWNLAVRIKPEKYGNITFSSGSTIGDYIIEFVGFSSLLDTKLEEGFSLSASILQADAQSALRESKRLYAGAHYSDYNQSSLLTKTDVKISSVRFWLDYLTDEELQAHSYDSSNYGSLRPNWRPEFLTDNLIVSKADMLLLNWTFDNVTGTDGSGQFIVNDVSSGSLETVNRYGIDWLAQVVGYQEPGFGFGFAANDSQVANKEYIYSAKLASPETFNGSDMIQVPDTDDTARNKTAKPVSFYFSIEKSMAQVINDEILNWFATIKHFNNLIGLPNQRYKKEYSDLVHMRKLFYEKVNNEPDYEKFLEFYKWIDSSISTMINQLAPASANISDKVRNIVENTVLDRNKYESKLASIKYRDRVVPLAGVGGNQLSYSSIHAPSSPAGSEWYKKRAIRTQEVTTGGETITTPLEPQNDIDREIIRQVINYSSYGKNVSLYSADTDTFYEGKKDISKIYSRHYTLNADKALIVEGKILGNAISNLSSSNIFQFAPDVLASSSVTQVIDITNNKYHTVGTPTLFDIATSSSYVGVRRATKTNYKYKNPYEYFQASGRSTNNKSFVDLEGNVYGPYSINALNIVERLLPNRNCENGQPRKTIFVERFSAPGGPEVNGRGMLDPVAEEFSVYNGMNLRNMRMRSFLDQWMLESGSIDPDNPSYHKTNRNVARYPADDNGTTINVQTDNGFISHAIPRSDAQYTWISASMSGNSVFSGYDSEYPNLNKGYEFISCSNLLMAYRDTPVNFSKYAVYYIPYNPAPIMGPPVQRAADGLLKLIVNSGSNLITYLTFSNSPNSNFIDPVSASQAETNVYLNNLNGPYGYPSWKQIRNYENPLSTISRRNNFILLQDQPVQKFKIVNGEQVPYIDRTSQTFTAYKEPPVEYNIPMQHTVEVSGSTGSISVISTHDNNLNKFANLDLMTVTGEEKRKEKQTHEVLLALSKGEFVPEPRILSASYTSIILPTKEHVGLKETRTRPNYTEVAGTGSNGYDRNIAEIRNIWRDSLANRKRTNAFYSSNKTGSINSLNIAQLSASVTSSGYSGYIRYSGSVSYVPQITASKNYNEYYDSINTLENENSYSISAISGSNYTQNVVKIESSIMGDLAGFDEVEARNFLAAQSGTYYMQEVISDGVVENVEYFRYDPAYNFVRPKPSYAYKIHYPSVNSNFGFYLLGLPTNANYSTNFINEGIIYKTNILAGKNPWYDSYEQYFENIKGFSTNATLLPEFNFSEHGDYYLKEKTVNNLPPANYISFEGSDANVNGIDNAYNITDKLDNFILNDLNGNKKIKISIDGVKKLLPYKGFYPQERTVQIVDLFQKSFFDISMSHITGGFPTIIGTKGSYGGEQESSGSTVIQQIQTLLQPLFAPGILFNSIKSGLAVDWPLYSKDIDIFYNNKRKFPSTGPFPVPVNIKNYVTASYSESSINSAISILSGNFDNRINFESIINLESFAKNLEKYLYYLDPTRYNRETYNDFNIYSYINQIASLNLRKNPLFRFINKSSNNNQSGLFKDDRYQLAINNFLAETPRFFLQGQNLTSFTSGKKSHELNFIAGKTYEMELVIEKEKGVEMFLDTSLPYEYYYVSESSGIITSSVKVPAASLFGPPCQFFTAASTGSEIQYGHKAYDNPAYAPYVPPYYFGPQYLKLSFTPTSSGNIPYDTLIKQLTASCYYKDNSRFNAIFSSSIDSLGGDSTNESFVDSTAYANRMPLTSSILYNVLVKNNNTKYSLNGEVIDITETSNNSNDKWRIQTKFETPILNFNTGSNLQVVLSNISQSGWSTVAGGIGYGSTLRNINFGFIGMWGGYAQTGSNSGVSLKLISGKESNDTGSLATACGFDTEITTKYVGQIASNKEISEAVVMIPFTYNKNGSDNTKALTINQIAGENTNDLNGPYYFSIDKQTIKDLLKQENINIDIFDPKITYQDIRNSLSKIPATKNSILNMMKLMTEYVVPPHLNWLFNRSIEPFVMYIFDFKHYLDGQELADIWQGVMPKSAMEFDTANVTLEHDLNESEFFHGRKLPDDIQWKVFKIKKRANYKYESLVDGKDQRFDFKPGNDRKELVYSYNWPYDYFSLVELVNIKASLEVQKDSNKKEGTA